MPLYKIKLDKDTVARLDIVETYQGISSLKPEIQNWLNENVGRQVDIDTMVKASLMPEKKYRLWNFTHSRNISDSSSFIFRFTNADDLMLFKLRWH